MGDKIGYSGVSEKEEKCVDLKVRRRSAKSKRSEELSYGSVGHNCLQGCCDGL